MTRSIHRSAVILSSLLFFSACEKKNESSSSSPNAEEGGPGKPTKSTRTDRHGGTRSERETAAKSALREALEAAESETDPAARQKALAQVAWDGIDIDRGIAQKAFAGLTPGSEEATKLVAHFAMRMADADPDAALEWARNLEQANERDDAVGRIAAVLAEKDPNRGAALATEELREGPMRHRAVVQVVQRWSQSKPDEAATWVAALPEGPARRTALVALTQSWSESDPASFTAWASANESQLPEMVSSVAAALRNMPDEKAREERISKIPDAAFRKQVEDEIKRANQLPFQK